MSLDVRVDQINEAELPPVEYRWDADTEILSARLRPAGVAEGLTGSMDIEGADGAWLMLEVNAGRLAAVEVAVWPDVATVDALEVPSACCPGRLRVPTPGAPEALAAVEVSTAIRAVADRAERTIHFRIGATRAAQPHRVASDLIVEVDGRSRLAGLWFLNVPPFPSLR